MKRIKLNKTANLKSNADKDVAKAIFNIIKGFLPKDKGFKVKDVKVATVPSGDKKYMVSFMVGQDDFAEGYADITVTNKPSNKFELKVKTMLVNACDQSAPVEPKAQFDPPGSTPAEPLPIVPQMQPSMDMPECPGGNRMRLRERLVQKVLNQQPSIPEQEEKIQQPKPQLDVTLVDALINVLQKVREQLNTEQTAEQPSIVNPDMRDAVKRVLYRIVNSL